MVHCDTICKLNSLCSMFSLLLSNSRRQWKESIDLKWSVNCVHMLSLAGSHLVCVFLLQHFPLTLVKGFVSSDIQLNKFLLYSICFPISFLLLVLGFFITCMRLLNRELKSILSANYIQPLKLLSAKLFSKILKKYTFLNFFPSYTLCAVSAIRYFLFWSSAHWKPCYYKWRLSFGQRSEMKISIFN